MRTRVQLADECCFLKLVPVCQFILTVEHGFEANHLYASRENEFARYA